MYYTQRWGLDLCKRFFGLTDADEAQIAGMEGHEFLRLLWEHDPARFYENPMQLLRQEYWHALIPFYKHEGFWAALPDGAHVLDYGCGVAAFCQPWILRGGNTTLVEMSGICRAYLAVKYPDPHVTVVDEGWLARAEPASVDGLICTDVLEHVPNPLELQDRLWALLKPGGYGLLKFETAYPHAGHLPEAIAQFPEWTRWVRRHAELIEAEMYAWVRKKEHVC